MASSASYTESLIWVSKSMTTLLFLLDTAEIFSRKFCKDGIFPWRVQFLILGSVLEMDPNPTAALEAGQEKLQQRRPSRSIPITKLKIGPSSGERALNSGFNRWLYPRYVDFFFKVKI